jgi:predicted lipoprotein with Yx(FWY)xxD motif
MKIASLLARGLAAFALVGCLASLTLAQPKIVDGILTDEKGMSLYVWDNDIPNSGKSLCVGGCSLSWPPMLAADDAKPAGDFTLIVRDDGKKQWAHKGKPLYSWVNDKKPGDRTGDGFRGGIWHLARP